MTIEDSASSSSLFFIDYFFNNIWNNLEFC